MTRILDNILQAIGDTRLVNCSRLVKYYGLSGRMLAKLEYLNPGFSKKDRVGLHMILEAEKKGMVKPGDTIVELTSGNTGTGLALASTIRGYRFVAVMSKGNSMERARMMKALGAEVVLVDQASDSVPGQVSGKDLDLVEEAARRIVRERKAFRADQFKLEGNVKGEEISGEEIFRDTEGYLDVFVDMAGSGGSFTGISRALKRHDPRIRCYLGEPLQAAWFAGLKGTGKHNIQGCGYSRDLPLLQKDLVDGYIQVSDEEARTGAADLARMEGIFGGYSSGAHVAAARKLLLGPEKGKTVVFLICDSGLKYLSTDLY
ncbi:MAG: cysteine synthase family protein [Synergistales bacterium]|nr:cysteine synthase family protein [Synergistales bacterium]